MIDFSKRLNSTAKSKKVNPIEIYNSLDRASMTGPLRPAQTRILEKWFSEKKDNKDLIAYICVDYGGRSEIVEAARSIARKAKEGLIDPDTMTEESFAQHLYTYEAPDPDLLIRTSGEERISNFLLWQLAYTEFYFTDKYWPDFDKEDLIEAINVYSGRQRRYGGK